MTTVKPKPPGSPRPAPPAYPNQSISAEPPPVSSQAKATIDSILVPGTSAPKTNLIPWIVGIIIGASMLAAVAVGIYKYWPAPDEIPPVQTATSTLPTPTEVWQPEFPEAGEPAPPPETSSGFAQPDPSPGLSSGRQVETPTVQPPRTSRSSRGTPPKPVPVPEPVQTAPATSPPLPTEDSGSPGMISSPTSVPVPTLPPEDAANPGNKSDSDLPGSNPIESSPDADLPASDAGSVVVPPSPPRSTKPQPAPYSGPKSGTLIWSGEVRKGDEVIIDGKHVSQGRISGELPGVACIVSVSDRNVAVAEAPGPRNQFKKIVLRFSRNVRQSISISWEVIE